MAEQVSREEICRILTGYGPLLSSWKQFARKVGLKPSDIQEIERNLLTKSIQHADVFEAVLAASEVRLNPCTVRSVTAALSWMKYYGAAEKVRGFGEERIITDSFEPIAIKPLSTTSGTVIGFRQTDETNEDSTEDESHIEESIHDEDGNSSNGFDPVKMKPPVWSKNNSQITDTKGKLCSYIGSWLSRMLGRNAVSANSELNPLGVCVKQARNIALVEPTKGYSLQSLPRGLALIVNNIAFEGEHERKGAEVDRYHLTELLTQIGFQIDYHEDVANKTELFRHLKPFIQRFREDPNLDACIITILTHGERDYVYMMDGKPLNVWKIVDKFNNSEKGLPERLQKIPKIFIFACCQIFPRDSGLEKEHPEEAVLQPGLTDTLVIFPALPGDFARRNHQRGTCFIYCLTKVFMEHAHNTDLLEMLNIVSRTVVNIRDGSVQPPKQQPYFTDFLLKGKLYFNPKCIRCQSMSKSGYCVCVDGSGRLVRTRLDRDGSAGRKETGLCNRKEDKLLPNRKGKNHEDIITSQSSSWRAVKQSMASTEGCSLLTAAATIALIAALVVIIFQYLQAS